ncbi:toll/interleukin-1 receptor domain-containing protein [Bacillus paralicheniformis]|uniref:toll/interleukin-1 receptor domain-containing protein n=1 Tax=Bacillus paralicheniformis TaxID=1648923 RepID=UPI002410F5FA|nr:toll/interleukin-1 receptor domain-containing protein [Bacillus paralicheniformis]WFF93925.1 toll/interleukin-1 receptor domain-containing protein [Bacillus paralicheniformis]
MKKENLLEVCYGPVYINQGKYKGIIGTYDDDEIGQDGKEYAIVYIGKDLLSGDAIWVPKAYLSEVTTSQIISRQKEIIGNIYEFHMLSPKNRSKSLYMNQVNLLNEFILLETILNETFIKARFLNSNSGKKIFISHSSMDKEFAKILSTDLSNAGHIPWLDEWNITVGESIPRSISKALRNSDFVLVILSDNANRSQWVQAEWENKYWDEISEGMVKVLPVLYKECQIPDLLKTKKYADFSRDYSKGLESLLFALGERIDN